MARDTRLTAIFQIRDQFSPVIKSIAKNWSSMANVINSQDFSKFQKSLRYARRSLHQFSEPITDTLSSVATPLAGVAASVGLSLQSIATSFMDAGGSIDDAAQRMGLSIESLQALRYAATMSGSSVQAFDSAMAKFSTNLANVAAGKNEDLAALFKALGISIKDAEGNIRSASDLLPELADGFERNDNAALRARMAVAAFGKAGVELIPMLKGGSAELSVLTKRAHDLGIVMSEEDVQAAAQLGDQFDEMKMVIQSLSNAMGAKLAPTVGDLFTKTRQLISANKEAFSEQFASVVNEFSKAIQRIDFQAIISGLITVTDYTLKAFNAIGGFSTVVTALGILLGSKVVLGIISFVGSLMTMIQSMKAVIVTAKALGLAMTASLGPVGPILIGIGLAASVVLANWEKIWPALKEGASAFFSWLSDALPAVVGKFLDVGKAIFCVWKGLFSFDLKELLEGMNDLILSAFKLLPDGISDALTESYESVKKVFSSIGQFISEFFENLSFESFIPDWLKEFLPSPKDERGDPPPPSVYSNMPVVGAGTMSGQMRIGVYGYGGVEPRIEQVSSSDNLEIRGDVGRSPRYWGD